LLTQALEKSNEEVSHLPLHNQIVPWAMKKNIDVVHRADNRLDWRIIMVK
jgi:peptide/nickel transport system substrate-binding protein